MSAGVMRKMRPTASKIAWPYRCASASARTWEWRVTRGAWRVAHVYGHGCGRHARVHGRADVNIFDNGRTHLRQGRAILEFLLEFSERSEQEGFAIILFNKLVDVVRKDLVAEPRTLKDLHVSVTARVHVHRSNIQLFKYNSQNTVLLKYNSQNTVLLGGQHLVHDNYHA
jgi:hypothetical protein